MIRNLWLKVGLVLLIAVSLCGDSLAQQTARIRFGRGRSSAVLSGTLAAGKMRTYILGVRSGQTITVQVNSVNNKAIGDIDYPSGDHIAVTDEGFWQGETDENGDYRISVINDGARVGRYTLTVTVR